MGQERFICGISSADQASLQPDDSPAIRARNAINYIPLKFQIIASNEGDGVVDFNNLLNNFVTLNRDFKSLGLQFYLVNKGDLTILNNTNIHEAPRDFPSEIQALKDPKAVNVFVTKNTYEASNGGTILAYYTKEGDHIVEDNSKVGNNSTLTHEMGHFFSLPHTFFGWEDDPYDEAKHGNPASLTTAPSYGAKVELMDKSNCSTSADKICDTPPDYNFGYTASGCNFNKKIRDSNGDTILTMKNNFMSYFSNCTDFAFTEGQGNAMQNNYSSSFRNYLRSTYEPTTDSIEGNTKLLAPINAQRVEAYNYVDFMWTEVPNATRYYIEVTDGKEVFRGIALTNAYAFTNLKPNKNYVWKVRPYNESFANSKTIINSFKTGSSTTATNELTGVKNFAQIFPNPMQSGTSLGLKVQTGLSGTYKLLVFNSIGQEVFSRNINLSLGENQMLIDGLSLDQGAYFLRLLNEKVDISQKFMVVE